MIAVAPRMIAALSIEEAAPGTLVAWGDSQLRWPDAWGDCELVDVLTGDRHHPESGADGTRVLPLGRVLSTLPVALLWGQLEGGSTRS